MHKLRGLRGAVERFRTDPLGVLAVGSVLLLTLLVAAVGTVAVLAESVGTWTSLFFMERTLAVAVPAVKWLLVFSLLASIGFVIRAS